MQEIKTKKKQEIEIKKLDRVMIVGQKLKTNIVDVKEKTKENYEKNEDTEQKYAENKIEEQMKNLTYYGIRQANKIGRNSLKRTKENLKKTKDNIKKVREGIKKTKKVGKETIKTAKRTVKNTKNAIKTAKKTIKTTEKTAKATVKTAKQVTKTSIKFAQRTVQMAKATIKAIQLAIKATIAIVKAIIIATEALISAIMAGGWVVALVIIVICLIALICSSIYGIFFSNEDIGDKTMSAVIREINADFTNKITEIQRSVDYNEYEINSNKAEWKDILSLYAVIVSEGNEQTDVITLNNDKINKLKEIFWQMNIITSRVEEIEKDIEVTEGENTKIEKRKIKMLYIDITSKSLQEMIELYNLNLKQKEQLAELQKDEYNSMWSYVLYGSSTGSNDIVEVARQYIGNIGGKPFWSWYGYSSRVEWCATFVSYCANECGYIERGLIPKFSNCQNEGVSWFKTCGLWQEGGYEPKARRYNIF